MHQGDVAPGQIDGRQRLEHLFGRERFLRDEGGLQTETPDDRGRFGPAAHNRGRAKRREHIGEPPPLLGVAQERRGPDARLKNDDTEPARRQLVDEGRRFRLARDLPNRRRGNGCAAHPADELGQFRAQARLEQANACSVQGRHASL